MRGGWRGVVISLERKKNKKKNWRYCDGDWLREMTKINFSSCVHRGRDYPPGGIGRDRGTSVPLGGRASVKRHDPPSTFIYPLPLNLRGGQALPTPGGRIPATDVLNISFLCTHLLCDFASQSPEAATAYAWIKLAKVGRYTLVRIFARSRKKIWHHVTVNCSWSLFRSNTQILQGPL